MQHLVNGDCDRPLPSFLRTALLEAVPPFTPDTLTVRHPEACVQHQSKQRCASLALPPARSGGAAAGRWVRRKARPEHAAQDRVRPWDTFAPSITALYGNGRN
jgi:hypothetical protein